VQIARDPRKSRRTAQASTFGTRSFSRDGSEILFIFDAITSGELLNQNRARKT
jgi:hypothetical protein